MPPVEAENQAIPLNPSQEYFEFTAPHYVD